MHPDPATSSGDAVQPDPATAGAEVAQPDRATSSADAASLPSLAELDTIADQDVENHPDVYQRIHTELQGALASIDDA
jgi:hypothetical protein